MELSEAKKECRDLIEEYLSCSVIGLDMQVDVGFGEKRCEAIDIVLKALDNSINKDEVRKLIEEVDKQRDTSCVRQMAYYFDDGTFVDKEGATKILKELLGEE